MNFSERRQGGAAAHPAPPLNPPLHQHTAYQHMAQQHTTHQFTVKARKLAYYGHTMRKQGSCLEKELMQGTMPGARRRGRPRTAWMDNIKTWTAGLSVEESVRMTEDRDKWRKYVHGVANPRIEDGWRTEQHNSLLICWWIVLPMSSQCYTHTHRQHIYPPWSKQFNKQQTSLLWPSQHSAANFRWIFRPNCGQNNPRVCRACGKAVSDSG